MKNKDFTHSTRLRQMKDNIFNLEQSVAELLRDGLQSGAKNITIFVYLDGFRLFGVNLDEQYVYVGEQIYPLVILPTDGNIIHCSGDVQLKYDT